MIRYLILSVLLFVVLSACTTPAAKPTVVSPTLPRATATTQPAAPTPTATAMPARTNAATAVPTATAAPTRAPAATPTPSNVGTGDPLTDSGNVNRALLTFNDLTAGASTAPVDDGAFALPAQAAPPAHIFEGRLELSGEATNGSFLKFRDDYRYENNAERKHLPEFNFDFVQEGSHLIPVQQGWTVTGHPYWNYIVGPGRIWKENADSGYSRASFPFALVERNQNCTHNGVMMFLFDGARVSNVRYQITQETCYYFKFNMWGQLSAKYTPGAIANAASIKAIRFAELKNRVPTKPISALATDFPNSRIELAAFGSGIPTQDMTTYGLLINGVNYVAGCRTRSGDYAYCAEMRLPSYSTAKSAFAAVALMRLGQKYGPGVSKLLVKDYVPEAAGSAGQWSNVTFDNTLDMATGNFQLPGYEADEFAPYPSITNAFLLAEPYGEKIKNAFRFPNKRPAGSYWSYHTTDTFIVTQAMNGLLQSKAGPNADIFNMLRDEVYVPAKFNFGSLMSIRTDNSPSGKPLGGYGLFFTQDDVAKLAMLLNNDNGKIGADQVLQPSMLADSMQKNPSDRGVNSTDGEFKYNNAFWGKEFTRAQNPLMGCSFWVPFMGGYGGIIIAMMPNGSTYYYFSDSGEFVWYNAVSESNKLERHCR